jgi:hypothetical protein
MTVRTLDLTSRGDMMGTFIWYRKRGDWLVGHQEKDLHPAERRKEYSPCRGWGRNLSVKV